MNGALKKRDNFSLSGISGILEQFSLKMNWKFSIAFFVTLTLAASFLYGQYIPYRDGEKWGFVSYETQEIVIPPKYESVGEFHEGMAVFQKGQRFGYLDAKGNEIIKAKYKSAGAFYGGYASVKLKKNFIIINLKGEKVNRVFRGCGGSDLIINYGKQFNLNGKYGYIACCPPSDTLLKPRYDYIQSLKAHQYDDQKFIARIDSVWGIVGLSDSIIVPFLYDTIIVDRQTGDSFAILKKENLYGAYNFVTDITIIPQYYSIQTFRNYVKVELSPSVFGYIDDKGRKYWK